MRSLFFLFPVLLLSICLAGCGGQAGRVSHREAPRYPAHTEAVAQSLYDAFTAWRSVPYREGGMSKAGVDCSGFVYLTFRTQFAIELPRTTMSQAESGSRISRSQLRPGDLVVFKTGWFERHVGIYVGEKKFIHASSTRGVMLSGLDDYYWKDRFWQGRRLFN